MTDGSHDGPGADTRAETDPSLDVSNAPSDAGGAAPDAPAAAAAIFGDRLDLAQQYAQHLANTGITHGLIGPREVPRLWDRHILNCAVIGEVIPQGATVIDVGSGAGLPGICLAISRPDLRITLVEPMERRTTWLRTVCTDLGLANVAVERARAEELQGRLNADIVTARAVAALDKLARWCLPLVVPGGRLVAMKGSSAQREITEAGPTLRRLGGISPSVQECGVNVVDPPTTVVIVDKSTAVPGGVGSRRRPGRTRP
ncbi:MAG: 16S rRNA (guanine(527)-N(7))-methyltransferase RsmG [Dermatophilaceae bacterium]